MYYLFLDESGDHGLTNIDLNYPVFVLCGILVHKDHYEIIRDQMNDIKLEIWNSKDVVFHSSDIRRNEKEFKVLFDLELKSLFYTKFNDIITHGSFTVIAACIDKKKYIATYGKLSSDIYETSLSFIIERTVFCLYEIKDQNKRLHIIIEKRGKKEDKKLEQHFQRIRDVGTYYVEADRIKNLQPKIHFRDKHKNINGLQLTDMVAYPIARKFLDGNKPNPAYDLVVNKIYQKGGKLFGFKIFP